MTETMNWQYMTRNMCLYHNQIKRKTLEFNVYAAVKLNMYRDTILFATSTFEMLIMHEKQGFSVDE